MKTRSLLTGVLVLAAGYGILQVLGRQYGSRPVERRRPLPGDSLVTSPTVVTNHARTIEAPPEDVWPWLAQTGWHRGGWYTARWVDALLFPDNWESAKVLDPTLTRTLRVGDRIPDGPPGTAEFVVVAVDEPRMLVLHSTTHLPPRWRERYGATLSWVWTFALDPEAGGTRLLVRTVGRTSPWWVNAGYVALIVPADFVMATSLLRGLARRVAKTADQSVSQDS